MKGIRLLLEYDFDPELSHDENVCECLRQMIFTVGAQASPAAIIASCLMTLRTLWENNKENPSSGKNFGEWLERVGKTAEEEFQEEFQRRSN